MSTRIFVTKPVAIQFRLNGKKIFVFLYQHVYIKWKKLESSGT